MANPSTSGEAHHETFSLPLFALTVGLSLAALLGALWWLAPETWSRQWSSTWSAWLLVFAAVSLVNCFVEFFFHRYFLHLPLVPFLSRLYRQHTLHHALTRISRRTTQSGRGILHVVHIENKYPITEPEQTEASFFPWYSLVVFSLLLTPLFVLFQWLLPSFPWLVGGYVALASSLSLYEILHAINHWSFETWEPLIEHRTWGRFWRPVYSFHLRHHAVIDCNESISGFFGLPVADWVFGTCVIPKTIYADGEEWAPEKFVSPRPCAFIRMLDRWSLSAVKHRREKIADSVAQRVHGGQTQGQPSQAIQGPGGAGQSQ